MPHPAASSREELLRDCEEQRTRRSGPGGQHRNKVETAIVLVHRPTGLKVEASERRSQGENRDRAVARMRLELAIQVRSPISAEPSELWRSRCHNGKVRINPDHADFPALLAEALDVLQQTNWDLPPAAQFLGCSNSQLLKLIQLEPAAIQHLNAERQAAQLRPLS